MKEKIDVKPVLENLLDRYGDNNHEAVVVLTKVLDWIKDAEKDIARLEGELKLVQAIKQEKHNVFILDEAIVEHKNNLQHILEVHLDDEESDAKMIRAINFLEKLDQENKQLKNEISRSISQNKINDFQKQLNEERIPPTHSHGISDCVKESIGILIKQLK